MSPRTRRSSALLPARLVVQRPAWPVMFPPLPSLPARAASRTAARNHVPATGHVIALLLRPLDHYPTSRPRVFCLFSVCCDRLASARFFPVPIFGPPLCALFSTLFCLSLLAASGSAQRSRAEASSRRPPAPASPSFSCRVHPVGAFADEKCPRLSAPQSPLNAANAALLNRALGAFFAIMFIDPAPSCDALEATCRAGECRTMSVCRAHSRPGLGIRAQTLFTSGAQARRRGLHYRDTGASALASQRKVAPTASTTQC
ncbi:hypothetical protein ERJ75_001778400 [Trypanosoma vivax]|nr:hypothetical protein ERJ75_001778400 [Trypanosoma vivax]